MKNATARQAPRVALSTSDTSKLDDCIVPDPARRPQGTRPHEAENLSEGVSLRDFYAYMPKHSYIFVPSREPWPATSVNARLQPVAVLDADGEPKLIPASAWLDRNQAVEQMTWAPGLLMLIQDRLIAEGGWIKRNGVSCFNLYRPPAIEPGDAAKAGPWIEHVQKVFGDDAGHVILWLAHRVQRPQEKINHALVLGGAQGIGKDTLLEPVKQAIGPWNFMEASPQQMLGRFNGFLKSVILRVSEARDLGDVDRFAFYDHMKAYTAAPPDVLRVDEKNLREHTSRLPIGMASGAGMSATATAMSPPISPNSTSQRSIQRPRRRRRQRFGTSSTLTELRKTPNLRTCSMTWAIQPP